MCTARTTDTTYRRTPHTGKLELYSTGRKGPYGLTFGTNSYCWSTVTTVIESMDRNGSAFHG